MANANNASLTIMTGDEELDRQTELLLIKVQKTIDDLDSSFEEIEGLVKTLHEQPLSQLASAMEPIQQDASVKITNTVDPPKPILTIDRVAASRFIKNAVSKQNKKDERKKRCT
ncbi:22246_t:CDS:2 [Entrophospora sp. SA101]|nr:1797_t:CDS:2 [Entrophospora sp. SA101]CAJ0768810.1 22246_t:CDS:2 [Entrophospora sp. SA101]CAJ0831329.1 7433_t:CDS:2 [Entrophospora sp. SA101]